MRHTAIIITPAFTHTRHELERSIRESGLPHLPLYGHSDLPRARSVLIELGLGAGADRLLLVDADTVPAPADLQRLASTEVDVTPERALWGLYPLRDGSRWSTDPEDPLEAAQAIAEGRQFRIKTGGLGVCAIHRESLERAVASAPTIVEDTGLRWRPWCVPFIVDGRYYPDDGSLCYRLTQSGTALWCDPTIRAGHVVTTMLTGLRG
jgi:hypothetical protein